MMQRTSVGRLILGMAVAAVVLVGGSALAQNQQAASQNQLDRIEQKLDRIIEHLGIAGQEGAPAKVNDARPSTGNEGSKTHDAPATAGAETQQDYQRGAVAIARIAPEKQKNLSEIPADSIGSFVYIGGVIPLSDLSRNGVRYPDLAAVELQGWLKVAEPGRTQLAVEYRVTTGYNVFASPGCIASLWLEDRSIGSRSGEIPMPAAKEKTISFVFGADLQPGLYKLRTWIACTKPHDLRVLNAVLLIKSPADMNLRMIDSDELLHRSE